jgi:hypothetical protein
MIWNRTLQHIITNRTAELRQMTLWQQSVFNAIESALICIDRQGVVTWSNKCCCPLCRHRASGHRHQLRSKLTSLAPHADTLLRAARGAAPGNYYRHYASEPSTVVVQHFFAFRWPPAQTAAQSSAMTTLPALS